MQIGALITTAVRLSPRRKRAVKYNGCGDLLWDELFEGLLHSED